jgi:hypothetical protein
VEAEHVHASRWIPICTLLVSAVALAFVIGLWLRPPEATGPADVSADVGDLQLTVRALVNDVRNIQMTVGQAGDAGGGSGLYGAISDVEAQVEAIDGVSVRDLQPLIDALDRIGAQLEDICGRIRC